MSSERAARERALTLIVGAMAAHRETDGVLERLLGDLTREPQLTRGLVGVWLSDLAGGAGRFVAAIDAADRWPAVLDLMDGVGDRGAEAAWLRATLGPRALAEAGRGGRLEPESLAAQVGSLDEAGVARLVDIMLGMHEEARLLRHLVREGVALDGLSTRQWAQLLVEPTDEPRLIAARWRLGDALLDRAVGVHGTGLWLGAEGREGVTVGWSTAMLRRCVGTEPLAGRLRLAGLEDREIAERFPRLVRSLQQMVVRTVGEEGRRGALVALVAREPALVAAALGPMVAAEPEIWGVRLATLPATALAALLVHSSRDVRTAVLRGVGGTVAPRGTEHGPGQAAEEGERAEVGLRDDAALRPPSDGETDGAARPFVA